MKITRKRKQFAIFFVDLVIIYVSLFFALLLRTGVAPSLADWWRHALAISPVIPLWILIFYTMKLYALETPFDDVHFVGRLAVATVMATLVTALLYYLTPQSSISPKTVLALQSGIAFLLLLGWRYLIGKALRVSAYKQVTAFVGLNAEARALISEIREKPFLGYEVAFAFDPAPDSPPEGLPVITEPASLGAALIASEVDLVVIADEEHLSVQTVSLLFSLIKRGVRFERLPDFYENLFRRVPIGAITETWFLDNIDLRAKRPYEIAKRGLDIVISTIILLLTCAIWPFIALGIKLSSPGPVFFKQTRLGRGGQPYTILKFRTMRVEGNDLTPTKEKDSRVGAFGAFLRKSRLDELPQFINIIKGEMSFIGPRPERPELAAELERAVPFYRQRLLAKPGLSGWDQVSGEYHSPSVDDTYKKLQYDLYYIKNMSPSLDASIFFKTIATVVLRLGR